MAQKTLPRPVIYERTNPEEDDSDDNDTIQQLKSFLSKHHTDLNSQLKQAAEDVTEQLISNNIDVDPSEFQNSVLEFVQNFSQSPEFSEEIEQLQQLHSKNYGENRETLAQTERSTATSTDVPDEYTCMYCTKYEPVVEASQVKPGDTIVIERKKGLYKHFATAITINNVSDDDKSANLTLVELQEAHSSIKTKTQKKDRLLDFRKGKIKKAVYTSNPFTPEEIVERALQMVDENEKPKVYGPACNNCEHCSNEISQSVNISTQADSVFGKIKSCLGFLLEGLCKFGSYILKIPGLIQIGCLISIFASTGLILEEMSKLKKLLKQGIICLGCYSEKYSQLKVSLVFSLITLTISCLTGFHVATVCTTGILGLLLPFVEPVLYRKLMPCIQPAFTIPKILVKRSEMVKAGDIITFQYYNLSHEGIVTKMGNTNCSESKIKLTIVHFPYLGPFGTYTVTKEEHYFNLKKDLVYVIDFRGTHSFLEDEVVRRAVKECGKTNHSIFSYRSSHLSRYCKTGKKDLENLPKKRAKTYDDITPGDVIEFKYCLLPHEAVVVKVEYAEKMECSIVHYNYPGFFNFKNRKVVEENFEFDLSHRNVFLHKYKNENVYDYAEVVRRAKSRIGEKRFNTLTNRSSHLAEWCKVKK